MKLVKVEIELVIDDNTFILPKENVGGEFTPLYDRDKIASYLNKKLYNDPEFFGEFGPENIVSVFELE